MQGNYLHLDEPKSRTKTAEPSETYATHNKKLSSNILIVLSLFYQIFLGGNSKTLMFANVGPADYNYDETIGTLR